MIVFIWQELVNICLYLLPLAAHSEVMIQAFKQHSLLSLPIMAFLLAIYQNILVTCWFSSWFLCVNMMC